MDKKNTERRQFLKGAAASAVIGLTLPTSRVLGANDRVRLGIIGPGARGQDVMKEFLQVPNVEFVATPLHCHAHHFLDTVAAGKDLYCEKTMTWSIDEAKACRAAVLSS